MAISTRDLIHNIHQARVVGKADFAGWICEQASGGAVIFPSGPAREFASGKLDFFTFDTRVHCFATKTNALAREIPPTTQVIIHWIAIYPADSVIQPPNYWARF